jgi:hypothetical protein
LVEALQLLTISEDNTNMNMSRGSSIEVDTSPFTQNTPEDRALAFGFHAPSAPRQIATTTLQEAAVKHELA